MIKKISASIVFSIFLSLIGCSLWQVTQPLRLYNIKDGSIIEVVLHPTSGNHGRISSPKGQENRFQGEYDIYDRRYDGPVRPYGYSKGNMTALSDSSSATFAELYGFSKNTDARPAGTGIIVGWDSTVVQVVFYQVSADLQSGDGVAKDNKGRYYRVYLSTESE